MLVFLGFICILLLIIAHEAGHFLAARRAGIEVEEFGVGFPPRAKVLTEKSGTKYTLNWLPLGGFVKLKGEHDSDTRPGSFGAANLAEKVMVMVAGVAANLLVAFLLFTVIALIGMPQLVENQFSVQSDARITRQDVIAGSVIEGSPAATAGLETNDIIRSINGRELRGSDELSVATKSLAGQEVDLLVLRGDDELILRTRLLDTDTVETSKDTDQPKGYLGVVPGDFTVKRYAWSAPLVGAGTTVQFGSLTLKGLGTVIAGLFQGDTQAAKEQVSGIVGVGFIFSIASFLGVIFMLMIVAVISLSLAIMNILPIPALDGGRLFVTLLFRLTRRPLNQRLEERIHGTGFALLMVLFVLITILDVQRFVF